MSEKTGMPEGKQPRPKRSFLKWTLAVFLIISFLYAVPSFFDLMPNRVASIAFFFGTAVFVCGYYTLIYILPHSAKNARMGIAADIETRILTWAARGSFCLVIFGLLLDLLGLLKLMGIVPWWS